MMRAVHRLIAMLGWLSTATALAGSPLPAMIDAHAHYSVPDAAAFPPEAVRAKLDAAGVERMVVTSSPPQLAQQLYRRLPDRVIPLLGVYESDRRKGDWVLDASSARPSGGTLAWRGLGRHRRAAPVRPRREPAGVRAASANGRHARTGIDDSWRCRGDRTGICHCARCAVAVGAPWHRSRTRGAWQPC